jgi:hypothetical protein
MVKVGAPQEKWFKKQDNLAWIIDPRSQISDSELD